MISFVAIFATLACFSLSTNAQIGGSVSSNPAGGHDVSIAAEKAFGTPQHNVGGSVFAAGNTQRGPVTTGGQINYNRDPLGLSLSKSHTPGVGSTVTGAGNLNLLNNQNHRLDANAFHSRNKLDNGFKFSKTGGGLDYLNKPSGLGAGVGISNIPKFGTTVDLTGRANLWNSRNSASSLDAFATGSRTFGGFNHGQRSFGAGLGLNHRF